MNVYDFDKTIYARDTTEQFYLWCLKRWPKIARRWPAVLWAALRLGLHLTDKTGFKDVFLRFLQDVPQPDREIERFWDENMPLIHKWYLSQRREDDVVITASPAALVCPACRRLGIENVLGSPVDIATGRYAGPNCHGVEKVRAFEKAFPGARVDRFYSDSMNDAPMAALATEAFMVRGEKLAPWPQTARFPKETSR
ncbi:MAG: haloacid dehalogenase-like hydrolase [Clostridia bacterium]|nr:haloacid dehalogenase-like hydrolase [Clostridia bacterium]